MVTANHSRSRRRQRVRRPTVFALSTAAVMGFGCNTILGIDEGHLVPGSGGSSGSTSTSGGSSGATHSPDSGTGGASGSGGVAAGGGGGVGGAPVDAGIDSGTSTGVANKVRCGLTSCDITDHLVCCRDTLDGANPHCALSCNQGTQTTFFCDGPEDCAGGQCCLPTGSSQAKCAASCAPTDFGFCAHHVDCGPGNYCTFGPDATLRSFGICVPIPKKDSVWCAEEPCDVASGKVCCYNKLLQVEACSKTCAAINTASVACDGPEDCPAVSKAGTDGGTVVTPGQCCATQNPLTGVYTGTRCNVANCFPVGCAAASDCATGEACCIEKNYGTACTATCTGKDSCRTPADCQTQSCKTNIDTAKGARTGGSACE